MITKRNFNIIRVFSYVATEVLFAVALSGVILICYKAGYITAAIPFSIVAILGSALAIFIAFRNNSAYGRWWEARTLWGGIVNSSRVFARLIITFTDSHAHQPNYDAQRSNNFKKELAYLAIAWVHALRFHLRGESNWQSLKPFMASDEYNMLLVAQHKPNYIQLLIGTRIYKAMANGTLAGFDSFQLEGQLLSLANYQGGCERIKNTPMLRQYHYFTRLFMYVFIAFLPFALIGDFSKIGYSWAVMPISVTITFVFAIIAKVGEVNEDPFENRITDVPVTAICNTIERDIKEMLGEANLPEKVLPQNGFLF